MPENPEIERMLRQEAERADAQAENAEGTNLPEVVAPPDVAGAANEVLAATGTEETGEHDISDSETLEHKVDAPPGKPIAKADAPNRPLVPDATGAGRPPSEADLEGPAVSTNAENPFSSGARENKLRIDINSLPDLQANIRNARQELLGDPDGDLERAMKEARDNGDDARAEKLEGIAKQEQKLLDILDDATRPSEAIKSWPRNDGRLVQDLTNEFLALPRDIRRLKTEIFGDPNADIESAEAKLRAGESFDEEDEQAIEELKDAQERLREIPQTLINLRSPELKTATGDDLGEETEHDPEFFELEKKYILGPEKGKRIERFEDLVELSEEDKKKYEGRTVEIKTRETLPNPDRLFSFVEQDLRQKLLPAAELDIARAEIAALNAEGEADTADKLDETRESWRQHIAELKRGLKSGQERYTHLLELQSRLEQGPTKENEKDLESAVEDLHDWYGRLAERAVDDAVKKHNTELRDYAQEILTKINGDKEKGIPPDKEYLKGILRYLQLRAQREERDDVG
jgi:hypothetical protein